MRTSGEIKWRGKLLYVSEALIGEPVGLEPVSDRHWQMFFGPVLLGLLDDHTGKLLAHRPRVRQKHGGATNSDAPRCPSGDALDGDGAER